jgi:N-acetylneuraminate synthase
MNEVFIIAEIGINHNGNIDTAKKLIDLAKSCGCDAVKFQKRDIDTVYSKKELDSFRESPWGKTFRDQKNGLEFQEKQYDEINVYCKTKKIEWFASAWDVKSLEFLEKYKLNYNKIASAMITNKFFLEHAAKKKIKTFISTGMSNYNIIDEAIDIFKKNECEFELMHSVSAYPCPEESLNLNIITKLKKKYNCRIGYSGHEPSVTPSIVAAALGINSLERHITLSRAMYGSDQSASLEESGLRYLVNAVRKVSKVLGSEDKKIFDIELPIAKKLRYWEKK